MNVIYQIKIGPWKQIGSTSNIKTRMRTHIRELQKGVHHNSIMQKAYNKYKSFEYKIIKECETREQAYEEEQILLDKFFKKPYYSMQCAKATGSGSGDKCIMYGKKRPDQSQRMRNNNPMHNPLVSENMRRQKIELYSSEEKRKEASLLWTEEKRKAQSINKTGSKNGRATKVKCIETGKVFDTIKDASLHFNKSMATIRYWNRKKIKVIIYDK
jgi:hypothetical protein